MSLTIENDLSQVDWIRVSEILKNVGMAYHAPDKHKRAFEASYATVFVYSNDRLIGFGRAISDGEYQGAVYDCAVCSEFQGQGVGSLIVKNILEQLPNCSVILYASPGKETFYQKHQFRKMKTGMALFTDSRAKITNGFTE